MRKTFSFAPTGPVAFWVFDLAMTSSEMKELFRRDLKAMSAFNPAPMQEADIVDPIEQLFGGAAIDQDFVEIFDVASLGDVSLTAYLLSLNSVSQEQVLADRSILDALSGPVVLVFPEAVHRQPVTIRLDDRMRYVGLYPKDAKAAS